MIAMRVIGLTGTIASGKEVVKEMISRKFSSYQVSLSGAIRGEMEKRNDRQITSSLKVLSVELGGAEEE